MPTDPKSRRRPSPPPGRSPVEETSIAPGWRRAVLPELRSDRSWGNTPLWILGAINVLSIPEDAPTDGRVLTVARAQHGHISRAQLLAIGIGDGMIRTRRRSGLLVSVHRGVYRVGAGAEEPLGPEVAALLACGFPAVLAERTALYLWGMHKQPPPEVRVAVLAGARRSRRGIRIHHTRTLSQTDVTTLKGLPVTTPARALLDLTDECTRRELELAYDEGVLKRAVSRTKVLDVLDRCGAGRRGAATLREYVEDAGPSSISRSQAEEKLRAMLVAAGIPLPHMNDPLHGYVADFHWREARYVVEVDGRGPHMRASAFERDRSKGRHLSAYGILVDRFTWNDLTRDPLKTVAHIATTVARRRAGDRAAA